MNALLIRATVISCAVGIISCAGNLESNNDKSTNSAVVSAMKPEKASHSVAKQQESSIEGERKLQSRGDDILVLIEEEQIKRTPPIGTTREEVEILYGHPIVVEDVISCWAKDDRYWQYLNGHSLGMAYKIPVVEDLPCVCSLLLWVNYEKDEVVESRIISDNGSLRQDEQWLKCLRGLAPTFSDIKKWPRDYWQSP